MTTTPSPELPDLDRLVRYDSFETDEGDELRIEPTGRWVRFDDVESLLARLAQHAESVAPAPDAERVDAIVTGLYRRFKDWSKRGFSADDVTWCEVKADVIALIAAQSQGAQTAYEELLQAARDLRGELVVANALIERRTRERDEALAAQQAAAPGALDDGDDHMWDTNTVMSYVISLPGAIDRTRAENVDDVLNALILMRRELPAPSAPGTPEAPDEDSKGIELWRATLRACGELPEGYEVRIELENGCGMAVWYDAEGERHVIDGEGYLSDDVNEAVDAAIQCAAQLDGGQGEGK
ncbi:hypothetical protein [Massilia sp. NP310]|uniref:hypothetical protein n=1 Tax=Massilia sp. NP310 TaxID=2861282 RepID=UPI001C639CC2|nr:hypothetical protein [Massilia sp. NP310]QYG01829.1 hypothetical protein KY496_26660 [Massilia sp. NP310]